MLTAIDPDMRIILVDNSKGEDNELTNALHTRLMGMVSEVVRCTTTAQVVAAMENEEHAPVHGICLGGSTLNMSASTVKECNVRKCTVALLQGKHVPILGVCFGMHYITTAFGGKVVRLHSPRDSEYEVRAVTYGGTSGRACFRHQDVVDVLPLGFEVRAVCAETNVVCEIASPRMRCLAVQYHPECSSGECARVLERFVCEARSSIIEISPRTRMNDRTFLHIGALMGKRSMLRTAREFALSKGEVDLCWRRFRTVFGIPAVMY